MTTTNHRRRRRHSSSLSLSLEGIQAHYHYHFLLLLCPLRFFPVSSPLPKTKQKNFEKMNHRHQHTSLTVVTKEDDEDDETVYVPLGSESTGWSIHKSTLLFLFLIVLDVATSTTYVVKTKDTNFSFTKSILDVIILCGVRCVFGLFYVMTKRMYVLASWASIWSAILLLCKFFLISKFTTFKTIVLVANLVLSILEVFALKSTTSSSSSKKKDAKKNVEDARAFFYDDPESRVNVSYLKLWILFKPYFFPSECSNQFRAALSYICMLISQGCSIYAPLTIGYATNALTRHDSSEAVKYIVLYVLYIT